MPTAVVTTVIVLLAAASDLRNRRIPNPLVVAGLGLGILLGAWMDGWNGLGSSLAGFGLGLLLVLPGYLLRFTGGGDVKLVAAVGSLLGAETLLHAFVLSALAAALMAVVQSLYSWIRQDAGSPISRYGAMLATMVATRRPVYFRPTPDEALGRKLPLAPAIALGTLAALWLPV